MFIHPDTLIQTVMSLLSYSVLGDSIFLPNFAVVNKHGKILIIDNMWKRSLFMSARW